MITALFVRHYKIYQGLYFIPICNDYNNKYSTLIGNNGVGKSSVLEALDTFFNNTSWNKNKKGKKDEAFIAPVFLIKKEELNEVLGNNSKEKEFVEFLSGYFWESDENINSNLKSDEFINFFKYKEFLKEKYSQEEYYLLVLGVQYECKNKLYFITFNKDVKNKIPEELQNFNYDIILEKIKEYYSYIYIPIHTTPSEILRIESKEIQNLMNADVLNEIDNILNNKKFEEGRRKFSVIDFINDSLNEYMDSVNDVIQNIDNEYAFKVEGAYKKNLTSSDVRKKILEAYFSIRTLKKDKQEINELSSGEQRIAIIDIATAFLLHNDKTDKKIIFAIDEPENSLHISKAFNQFERLEGLSSKHQIVITTHWYGALPVTTNGNLQYLEKDRKIKISYFNFNNYFENRRNLPNDLMLKSYFELASSILSSMRADNTNWIICEGSDDKLYLKHYLKDIPNLKLLSVGGCGNVTKLYQYLYIPFSERDEGNALDSKVLCIIDTDDEVKTIDLPSETRNKKLRICRIQHNRENKIELKKIGGDGYHNQTEIEDCLIPKVLYEALSESIKNYGNEELTNIFNGFEFNEKTIVSRIKGELSDSILYPKDMDSLKNRDLIYKYMNDNRFKFILANNYIKNCEENAILAKPQLFELIKVYFLE